MKMNYDLVVSLGGNCSVAHNLRYRDMRLCSYPFDWVAMTSNKCVAYLAKGFRNGFVDFMREENCRLMPGTVWHDIIVKDDVSGFLFPNHFTSKDFHLEFPLVATKMKRRISRLMNNLTHAKRALFILAAELKFEIEDLKALEVAITESYPELQTDIRVMQFSAPSDSVEEISNQITIYSYKRPRNDYDFYKTNYEWSFLDEIVLPGKGDCRKGSIRLFSMKLRSKRYQLRWSWGPL